MIGSLGQEPPTEYPSIWLSLSGGGFRAALFHYGCLKRLHELGLLRHVYAVAATSGGSVVAALLAHHWRGTPTDDERSRGITLDSVDWDAFERAILGLVQRGALGPISLLVSAYAAYGVGIGLGLVWFFDSGQWLGQVSGVSAVLVLAVGMLLHLSLLASLWRAGAHRASSSARRAARINGKLQWADWARPSKRRLLRMLTCPSFLRRQTLNLRAFEGNLLSSLFHRPKLFVTAVDLNSGKEIVFTAGHCAGLDAQGCRALWDQRTENPDWESNEVEIAEAVSASSAFPPVFKPVPISNRRGSLGVFVDGGVFDNLALNVARALAVHIHAGRGQRYSTVSQLASFEEQTSLILAIDGGKLPTTRASSWGRLRMIPRLLNILVDQQFDRTMLDALTLERVAGIDTVLVGLHVGTPPKSEIVDAGISAGLASVRTHFDAYSLEECASIAYCGYMWIDEAIGHRITRYAHATWVAPLALAAMLPTYCGQWDASPDHLRVHLRYSRWRLGAARWIARALGRGVARS